MLYSSHKFQLNNRARHFAMPQSSREETNMVCRPDWVLLGYMFRARRLETEGPFAREDQNTAEAAHFLRYAIDSREA